MADEAVIIELINGGEPIRYTVADGTQISKGSLMVLSDPRTATKSSSTDNPGLFCGIAATDKEADDGETSLACYTKGVFDLKAVASVLGAGGQITAGDFVVISGGNLIRSVDSTISRGTLVGVALETASAS